jgi:hypothetical protein
MLPAIKYLAARAASPEEWGGVDRDEVAGLRCLIDTHCSMRLPRCERGSDGLAVVVATRWVGSSDTRIVQSPPYISPQQERLRLIYFQIGACCAEVMSYEL